MDHTFKPTINWASVSAVAAVFVASIQGIKNPDASKVIGWAIFASIPAVMIIAGSIAAFLKGKEYVSIACGLAGGAAYLVAFSYGTTAPTRRELISLTTVCAVMSYELGVALSVATTRHLESAIGELTRRLDVGEYRIEQPHRNEQEADRIGQDNRTDPVVLVSENEALQSHNEIQHSA